MLIIKSEENIARRGIKNQNNQKNKQTSNMVINKLMNA